MRTEGALFGRSEPAPPWTRRFADGASMTLYVPLRGEGRLAGRPIRLGRGGDRARAGAVRRDGGHDAAVGAYRVRGEVPGRLLRVLPPVLVVPDEHDCAAMRDCLEFQLAEGRPGRQIVLDRLLDWLLVCTRRDWFDRPEAEPPFW